MRPEAAGHVFQVIISATYPIRPLAFTRLLDHMFDYYRFRFSMFKGWNPEFGYELMAPAGLFGAILILFILYLTSPDFGFLMWRSSLPTPGKIALAVVLVLIIAAYAADDLKRAGLWLITGLCAASLVGTLVGTIAAVNKQGSRLYYSGMEEPPSAYVIGFAFAVYLSLMLLLTMLRLRDSTDR